MLTFFDGSSSLKPEFELESKVITADSLLAVSFKIGIARAAQIHFCCTQQAQGDEDESLTETGREEHPECSD